MQPSNIMQLPGKRLAVITPDNAVHVVDPSTGDAVPALPACDAIAIAKQGSAAAAVCSQGVSVADLATGDRWSIEGVDTSRLSRVAMSSDGEWLVAVTGGSTESGYLIVWRVGLPRGAALAAWVGGLTNAIAPHGATIEWE
jgi:hypothetical protein